METGGGAHPKRGPHKYIITFPNFAIFLKIRIFVIKIK